MHALPALRREKQKGRNIRYVLRKLLREERDLG